MAQIGDQILGNVSSPIDGLYTLEANMWTHLTHGWNVWVWEPRSRGQSAPPHYYTYYPT